MPKKETRLYAVLLDAFAQEKQKGSGNEESFVKAKLEVMSYFVKTPNVGKHALAMLWARLERPEFTQQLALDYQLKYRQQKAAQLSARPNVG
mgnify:CR=1 FL=1